MLTEEQRRQQARDARAIAAIVGQADGGGLHQDDVLTALGWPLSQETVERFRGAMFLAWRWGLVEFGCKPALGYMLAPPPEPLPPPDRWVEVEMDDGTLVTAFSLGLAGDQVVEVPQAAGWARGKPVKTVAEFYARR